MGRRSALFCLGAAVRRSTLFGMAAFAALIAAVGVLPAEEPNERIENVRCRVTGLFQPDRVDDFRAVLADKMPELMLVSIDYVSTAAEFRFNAAKVFPNVKDSAEFPKVLNNLVRGKTEAIFGVRPLLETPRDKLTRIEIRSSGSTAKHAASQPITWSSNNPASNKPRLASRTACWWRGSTQKKPIRTKSRHYSSSANVALKKAE